MILKLKLQYFGHLMRRVDSLEKTDAGRDWGQGQKGTPEDELAGWHTDVALNITDMSFISLYTFRLWQGELLSHFSRVRLCATP